MSSSRAATPSFPPAARWSLVLLAVLVTFGDVLIQELHGTAAFYAALSREMLEKSDWFAPFRGEGAYLLKPPLAFWLSAASSAVLGINDFAMTLPSRLAGLGCVAMTWLLARRYYGETAAWFAALILPTNGLYIQFTTNFRMDSLMTLGGLLMLWGYLNLRKTWGVSALCGGIALSLLTKGPMILAMLLPFAIHGIAAGTPWRPARGSLLGLAWLLLPVLWFGYLWSLHGNALTDQLNHDFWRGDTAIGLSALDSALLEYLLKPLRRLWPWLPLMIAALVFALREILTTRGTRAHRADVALVLFLFLVNYAIAAVKPDPDVRYLYPSLPLVAILVGGMLTHWTGGRLPASVRWGGHLLVIFAVIVVTQVSLAGKDDAAGLREMRKMAAAGTLRLDNTAVITPFIPAPGMPRRNDPLPDSLYYYFGFVPSRVVVFEGAAALPAGVRYVFIRRTRAEEARLSSAGLVRLAQSARISLFEVR